jgi:hypothetical protein
MVYAHLSTSERGYRRRQHKRCRPQERLLTGLAAAQGIEGDAARLPIHFTAHQTRGPECSDRERVAQHLHGAMRSRAAQLDYVPTQGGGEVSLPPGGKRPPRWGRVDASHRSPVVGGEVTGRPAWEIREGVVMETGPYLGLPLGIEAFNGGLKAGLPRGHEHRDDLEGETEPDDPAPASGC